MRERDVSDRQRERDRIAHHNHISGELICEIIAHVSDFTRMFCLFIFVCCSRALLTNPLGSLVSTESTHKSERALSVKKCTCAIAQFLSYFMRNSG